MVPFNTCWGLFLFRRQPSPTKGSGQQASPGRLQSNDPKKTLGTSRARGLMCADARADHVGGIVSAYPNRVNMQQGAI